MSENKTPKQAPKRNAGRGVWQSYTLVTTGLVFILLLFFQNCRPFHSPSSSSSGEELSPQCTPKKVAPFEQSKVQLKIATLNQSRKFQSLSEQKEDITNSSLELILIVDPLCVERESPIEVLGQVIQVPSHLKGLQRAALALSVQKFIDLDQLKGEMDQSPCLIGISENELVRFEDPPTAISDLRNSHNFAPSDDEEEEELNDPRLDEQKHLQTLNYMESLEMQDEIEETVVVAVVDSGVDLDHPDLADRIWTDSEGSMGRDFSEEGLENGNNDVSSHGTHVAGIIAADQNNSVGIAGLAHSYTHILPVKIFHSSSGESTLAPVYNGIRYAIEQKVDVINLSLGDPNGPTALEQAVFEAVSAGIVVVASAGNGGREIGPHLGGTPYLPSPASVGHGVQGVIAVGSIDTDTTLPSVFANTSSRLVEISAPGAEMTSNAPLIRKGLLSTLTNGSWGRKSGTSMAVPVVSAAAAFVIGYFKANDIEYTMASVEKFLKEKGSQNVSALTSYFQEGRLVDFQLITQNLSALGPVSEDSPPVEKSPPVEEPPPVEKSPPVNESNCP